MFLKITRRLRTFVYKLDERIESPRMSIPKADRMARAVLAGHRWSEGMAAIVTLWPGWSGWTIFQCPPLASSVQNPR